MPALLITLVVLVIMVIIMWTRGAGRNRDGIPTLSHIGDYFDQPLDMSRAARRARGE